MSKAFGSTLSKEKLLVLIVESAIETMDAKAACLFMADRERDVFIPTAQRGLSDTYLHAKPLRVKAIVQEVLRGGYLTIHDATTDPRVEHHDVKRAEGIASLLDVPVMARDEVIGILALYRAVPRDFSTTEIEFLTALAEQGGMAIAQARLLERIRKNPLLFLDLATNINPSLDAKQILHNLTVDICEALGMKGVMIRLLNKETGNLQLVASHGLSGEFFYIGPVSAEKSVAQAMKGETSVIMRLCSAVKRDYPEDIIVLVSGLAIQNASLYMALQDDMKEIKDDVGSHRSWF